jgi:hypothetical protein
VVRRFLSSFCLVICWCVTSAGAQQIAFPGAEGFGRFASGGRGGDVYVVTNLNDSGAGSLRAGVTGRNVAVPRTVVFAVSGTIYLQSTLRITQGNITIAGQTAPGDGICLAYRPLDISNSTNVIIRFLRVRLGDVAGVETDAFTSRYSTNVIIDHCSFSWSVDETSSTYDNTNLTQQWCFITESMRDSVHSKGAHGYGGIWGGKGASYHHNLIAHHDSRNPRFNGARTHGTADELVDMRNNVIYNWRGNSTYGGEPADTGVPARHNIINNTYKNGPATSTSSTVRYRILEPTANSVSTAAPYSLFHISGNWTTASSAVTTNNWNGGVQVIASSLYPSIRSDTAFAVPPVITQTAQNAYPLVLAYAGCRLPVRDVIDTRIAGEVANGTATYRGSKGNTPGIIDSQTDVGGWPALAAAPAPTDTDNDGMPDAWETARGLNPALASDRNLVDSATGYTQLELYLNELAAPAFPIPTITASPQAQSAALGGAFTLSVTATGTGPLSYQWYKGATPLAGSTGTSYSVASSGSADAGDYSVVVGNDYGSVRSATATVSLVSQPPSITTPPASLSAAIGQGVTFTVTATGSAPLSYQWFKGANPITGATAASHTIPAVASASAGNYHVVVSNPYGSVPSAAATLTVVAQADELVYSTAFAADTIHAATPSVTPTASNWYVLSSKNASATATGDDPATAGVVDPRLDLTMALTTSGVVESAALFATAPRSLTALGDQVRVRATVVASNVRVAVLGLYHSGGVLPHTGMINGQLANTLTNFATGGAQGWLGYRAYIDAAAASPAAILEGRLAQAGANNASQSLLVAGVSSAAPAFTSIGSAAAPGFTYAAATPYTLTLTARRVADGALALDYTVHTGTDTSVAPLALTTATIPAASALASAFDAVGIGYRNANGDSVSRLRVTSLTVTHRRSAAVVLDAYEQFLADYALDPGLPGVGGVADDPDGDGLPNVLEFVLGGDPGNASHAPLPSLAVEAGTTLAFTYVRQVEAASLFTLTVERSADLGVWETLVPGTGGVSVTVVPPQDAFEQVTLRAPLSGPAVFYRLRVTTPAP